MENLRSRAATRSMIVLSVAVSPMVVDAARAQAVSPTPSDQEDVSGRIENIVVTAQRRDESAQDVPISLQHFSSDDLEKAVVRGTEDLTAVVGGLIIQPTAARPMLFLRGVGTNSSNTTAAVLTFIDGVYQPFGQSTDLVNVERVDVLKGPQGTLFGRNATGGVIQITTQPPSETLGGRAEVGYGNYNTVDGSAYITGGLADGVAMDVSLRYRDQDEGFGTNVFNGEDVFLSRRVQRPLASSRRFFGRDEPDTRRRLQRTARNRGHERQPRGRLRFLVRRRRDPSMGGFLS